MGDLMYLNKKSKKKNTPVVGIAGALCGDYSLASLCADGSLYTWNCTTPYLFLPLFRHLCLDNLRYRAKIVGYWIYFAAK